MTKHRKLTWQAMCTVATVLIAMFAYYLSLTAYLAQLVRT